MPVPKNILIAGASGMVGNELFQICLYSNDVNKIYLLSRKAQQYKHAKVHEIIVDDFLNHDFLASIKEKIDVVFYCIGVYTGAAEKKLFEQITVQYPVALARSIIEYWPSSKFILLSGSGADRSEKSGVMFAKYKGMAENQLYNIFKTNFHSARPGYIYPILKRQEPNFMYSLMRTLYPVIKWLGKKYSITSVELAKAIFALGMQKHQKITFENESLIELSLTVNQRID